MQRLAGHFLWMLCAVLLSGRASEARPLWNMPPLSSFDGARWGDLRLGQTTFRQVRAAYETGDGIYVRSTELTQPKNTPLRVDLLWDKRGDQEVLEAIAVSFVGTGPLRAEVERLFDPQLRSENFTQKGRFEAWRVARLASKGVAFFTLGEPESETAPLILLAPPQSLRALSTDLSNALSSEYMPVETRFDPHENEPKRAEFGRIKIDFSGDDDLELSRGERNRARDGIEEAEADGALRFSPRSDGRYEVSAKGREKGKNGGSVAVGVSIRGDGPYGTLSATGSATQSWSWSKKEQQREEFLDNDQLNRRLRDAFREALRDARRQAENSFARQMEKSGPPPLSQVRQEQWQQIIESVRAAGRNQALFPAILR